MDQDVKDALDAIDKRVSELEFQSQRAPAPQPPIERMIETIEHRIVHGDWPTQDDADRKAANDAALKDVTLKT